MAEHGFSPDEHRFAPSRYFDDLAVGEQFYIPSRTMTEALFAAFQLASGDNHPIHYDRVYCQARGHRDLLAHGLMVTVQAAAGAGLFPHVIGDSLIAFLEQSSRFLRPVQCRGHPLPHAPHHRTQARPDETGVVVMRATIHNQAKELVMEGEHQYLLRRRPTAHAADA